MELKIQVRGEKAVKGQSKEDRDELLKKQGTCFSIHHYFLVVIMLSKDTSLSPLDLTVLSLTCVQKVLLTFEKANFRRPRADLFFKYLIPIVIFVELKDLFSF